MLVPNRHKAGDDYRYGFNGKELDNEVKGEGNSYDFGARMLDPRVGRWFAPDPKEHKFPNESTYIYVGNNPIIAVDPDGEQKIVVTGGADLHNKNRMNFILAAKNQIKEYKKQIKASGSKENVAWLILDKDYTAKEKKSFETWAKKNGIEQPIYVSSTEEITNYMNSKSLDKSNLTIDRLKDGITSLSFMSHGVPSQIALGYDNTGYTFMADDKTNFGKDDINKLNSGAFLCGTQIDIFSCNAATPTNMEASDYTSIQSLVKNAMKGNNLVKDFSKKVSGATLTGYIGQTSYMKVGLGELPSGATLDGSYSPTVNGESPESIKVKMQDGKIQE
jgi:RHS repeat-associated protein